MEWSLKHRLALVTVALGALAGAALPANAVPGTFTVTGGGTISPGLPLCCVTPESFDFSGSGSGATGTYVGPVSCAWNGTEPDATLTQGAGNFSGTCTTSAGNDSLSGTFTRSGGSVTMSGNIGAAPFAGNFTAACAFAPGPPPVMTYQETCTFTVT